MEKIVFLDIETIPAQSPEVLDRMRDEVKAPANIKKPESIEAWLKDNRESAARDALAKTSFDPALGHICTIAWAIDDDFTVASHAVALDQEAHVISAFFDAIDDAHYKTFIGHYISGFDLRFILCRAVVLGVKIPQCIPRDIKPWHSQVFDTMTAWAGQKSTISMDGLCRALGIDGKGDFDGSMVAEAWANDEHEKIAQYCIADVDRAREIWRKFQAAGW